MLAENVHVWEKLDLARLPAEVSEFDEVGEVSEVSKVGKVSRVSKVIEVSKVIKLVIYFSSKCSFARVHCSFDNPAARLPPKFRKFFG